MQYPLVLLSTDVNDRIFEAQRCPDFASADLYNFL
jgi:hypothetical protein